MTNPANILRTARENVSASNLLFQEGFYKIAISRAYYAMFYACEALLLSRGLAYSSHSAVVAAFGKEFAKTGEVDAKYHRYLIDAQDARNLSDYGDDITISVERARQIIDWANEFISMADEYLRNLRGL